ncbi:MAG TPA: hypothetical protein VHY84_27440 [Bryobacteraceae bacterium]|nr:hypothetical protein [Bryobacteraceae bacterium]
MKRFLPAFLAFAALALGQGGSFPAPSGGGLGPVVLSGTPSTGQVPTATSPTAATWQSVGGASVTESTIANSEYIAVSGTNTLTGSTTTTYASLSPGFAVRVLIANTNTGAVTFAPNSITAAAVTKDGTAALSGGELVAGHMYLLQWDGAEWQITAYYPSAVAVTQGILAGTYTSGITAVGTSTQTCNLALGGGATATIALTGTNAIAAGTSLVISAAGSNVTVPASATVTSGTAVCSGTAVVAITSVSNTYGSVAGANVVTLTLGSTVSSASNPTGAVTNQIYTVVETQDANGGHTALQPSAFSHFPPICPDAASLNIITALFTGATYQPLSAINTSGHGCVSLGSPPAAAPLVTTMGYPFYSFADQDFEMEINGGGIMKGFLAGVDVNPVTGQLTLSPVTCVNQFVSIISARGVGTCSSIGTAALPVSQIRRTCIFDNDTQSSTALTAPQFSGHCPIPAAATIVEVDVSGGTQTLSGTATAPTFTGTSSVQIGKHGGTNSTGLLSAVLATVAGVACALPATSGTCLFNNAMTSSSTVTVSTTSLSAGDELYVSAANPDTAQTWYNVTIVYTVN